MEENMKILRFNYTPLNLALSAKKKAELRIGYMESALKDFYLNSLETGANCEEISNYLLDKFNCKNTEASHETFQFLINEGDRTAYAILLPHLTSAKSLEELECIIRNRFFGVERFTQQGKNLYHFLQYIAQRKELAISVSDLEKGIIGWDMGQLVVLVRAAREKGYIAHGQAWEYIKTANKLCAETLRCPQEADKSFLIGQAMNLNTVEEWENLILHYTLVSQTEK